MAAQCFSKLRKVTLHDISDNAHVDSEVLMDEDVTETSDLWPGNLWVHAGDLSRKMIHCFADDLQSVNNARR